MFQRLLLTVLIVWSSVVFNTAAADRPPNIVFILADDLGYGDLSCFGQGTLKTPNLDRMAGEGMRLTRHYAGSTVCAPSRCVFLTGKHAGHGTVRGNGPGILGSDDILISDVLKRAGYATGCSGKWGVGNPPPLDDPNQHGFDHFYGYVSMWHAHNFYPEFLIRNGKKSPLRNEVPERWKAGDGRGVATKKVDYAPDMITRDALDFVGKHKDGPFFLYWAMNVPHANNEGRNKGMEVPSWGEFGKTGWPEPEKGFASMIRNIDTDVGKMLGQLKQFGLEENTIVIFTSDNGPHQEGGHKADYFNSNGGLRGKKRDLYEGGIRVPTIVRWPGHVAADSTSDLRSGFQDWFATFSDLAGVDAEAHDGISLRSTLIGKGKQRPHPYLYWEFLEQGGKQAVLKDNWKAVRVNWVANPNSPIELFDLSKDKSEQTNVATSHPEIVAEMADIMKREHTPQSD
ncbi:MAG: arylsulfatase [Planctomycetaceae bacterium]|nr:arylsulfatase [Planctomycetaceae bacterium]